MSPANSAFSRRSPSIRGLPGVSYPAQENRIELSAGQPGALPADEADIAYASVRSQAHWIRTGQITSRRLTEIYLSRIERIAPQLYCYITVTGDHALAQADESDRELAAGRYRGELHGIPYGIKDCFDTAGIPTTWGAIPFQDRVPDQDARIVTMLRDAGAVLLGKLATASLANGYRWYGGKVRNPWNTEEHAGGSSAGPGSATAAALCSFSIGTDSLGSILNPADQCGIVGLRATFGRVPTKGAMPLTPSLDRIGPLTRRVEDAVPVLAAINGPDPTSACSLDMGFDYDAGLDPGTTRVGYSEDWFGEVGFGPGASTPVGNAHRDALDALRELGVELVEVELPPFPYSALIPNLYVEAAAIYEALTLDGRDDLLPPEGWPDAWRRVRLLSAVDYLQAERLRRHLMHRVPPHLHRRGRPLRPDLRLLRAADGHELHRSPRGHAARRPRPEPDPKRGPGPGRSAGRAAHDYPQCGFSWPALRRGQDPCARPHA